MRYFDTETVRILYRAKRNTTSLIDVKIDIWNNSGTKVVNAQTLTELANGLYYYDYVLSAVGNFLYNVTCATQPHDVEGTIVSVGKNSRYFKSGGGGGGLLVTDLNSKELGKINTLLNNLQKTIRSLQKTTLKSFSKIEDNASDSLEAKLNEMKDSVELVSSIIVQTAPTEVLLKLEDGK